jgi:dGTPase
MGDYHRTRLTHTLEVSSIARTIARTLRLNEDLVEAAALAHDVGHPPFWHSGEDILDECLQNDGGFNHNARATDFRTNRIGVSGIPWIESLVRSFEGQQHRAKKGGEGRVKLLPVPRSGYGRQHRL